MILPSKHISISESLLGLGGILLTLLKTPTSIDTLWRNYSKINDTDSKFPAYHDIDDVILSLNFLYLLGIIEIDNQGKIYIETSRT